ncbi:MAG TPA: hypothetical protein ENJ53_05560 [Phaeodactylibacter sp.]|nr:hypothetical protein [Phaeodactylibacter sp.]
MKNISFLLLLLFLASVVLAQKPFYHKNKAITWVSETEFIYHLEHFDRLNFEPATGMQEETRTIKIDPYATCEFGNEKYFTNFIIHEIMEGRREVTSLDGEEMGISEIKKSFGAIIYDTLITYDPTTNVEKLTIIQTEPLHQVKAFKVRQWWFYDKEKKSLGSVVRAIAPIIEVEKADGSLLKKTLFWVKMEQPANQTYDYNDPSVIWAKETISSLSFKKIKKLKGRTKKTLKNLTYKYPHKGKVEVLENDSWYPYCAEAMDVKQVQNLMGAQVDTVITIDPDTYKEETKVVKSPKIKYKNFEYYRVLQHWYFDKSTNTLASKVISIGPLQNIYDDKGKFRFRRALYYIMSAQ